MVKNEAKVTVTGWLNDTKAFEWGNVGKVAVDQRRKNDITGEWETVDKTVYDVAFEGIFPDAKQVTVTGRITGTNTFEKRDGSTGVSIKVRAESVDATEDADAPF
jgi:fibrillarin-like rRNA methylase